MGSASSNIEPFNQLQIQEYTEEYNRMEVTIATHNLTIQNLLADKKRLSNTVKNLEETMSKKEEDMRKCVSDIKADQQKVHTELSKYKSIPEFEDILSLYTKLLEFQNKIDSSLSSKDLFKVSKDEEEINKLKKSNLELSKQLTNIGGKSVLHEKAAELQAAESEVNAKKDLMRQEFLKNNGRLVKIKEKMKECTTKFAGTMSNAIIETKNQLQKHKKEFSEVDCITSKLDDNIPYAKVMNILLQQQNTLMKEIIITTGGAGPSNPSPQNIHNNLRPTPYQPVKTNIKPLMSISMPICQVEDNQYDSDNDDTSSSSSDDDISETGSVSENTKPFKLIMYNIPDWGNDQLFVKEVLKTLTDLPLDDIMVKRLGKPGLLSTPILVCFEKINYIHQILKAKHTIKDGPFSNVKINTFKAKIEITANGKPHNNAKSDGKKPNQQGPSNPSPQNIHNNLRPTPNQPVKTNIKQSISVPICQVEDNQYGGDNDDNISETGSVSEDPKPFKLLMHNIPDGVNNQLYVMDVIKTLTDLPLDNIVVRKIGKHGTNSPILVCFEKCSYIHLILRKKHMLKHGPFSKVWITMFNASKGGNAMGTPYNNGKQNDNPEQNRTCRQRPNNQAK